MNNEEEALAAIVLASLMIGSVVSFVRAKGPRTVPWTIAGLGFLGATLLLATWLHFESVPHRSHRQVAAFVSVVMGLLTIGSVLAFVRASGQRSVGWLMTGLAGLHAAILMGSWQTYEMRLLESECQAAVLQHRAETTARQVPKPPTIAPAPQRLETVSEQTVAPDVADTNVGDSRQAEHPNVFGDGTAWLREVEEEFEADVYPSARSAAKALARKVQSILDRSIERVNENSEEAITPFSIIQVSRASLQHPEASLILGDLAEVMRQNHESAQVLVESAPVESKIQDSKAISIVVDAPLPIAQGAAVWDATAGQIERDGSLRATVQWRFGTFSTTARFVEKPWVTNFSEYISTRPQYPRLLAQSVTFTSSEFEARQQAYQQAATALLPILRQQLGQYRSRQRRGELVLFEETDQQLVARLVNEMHKGSHFVDRFPQRLTKTYGDVWREAILVEISTPQLKYHVTRSYNASMSHRAQVVPNAVSLAVSSWVHSTTSGKTTSASTSKHSAAACAKPTCST